MANDVKSPAYLSAAAVSLFVGAFAVLLTADLLTKRISFDRLLISITGTPPEPVVIKSHTVEFIPNILNFHVTANQGAVFGLGQGRRWLFVLVSVVMIPFLSYLFATTDRSRWPTHLLLAGLLAGVLGNMWDRITIGYVRDMLWMLPNVRWGDVLPFLPDSVAGFDMFPWIFNLADTYLVTGVGVVLIHAVFARDEPRASGDSAGERDGSSGSAAAGATSGR